MRWTLFIDPIGRPGRENMGIDYALLHAVREGDAFVRLYRWNPPCLSFGRNEPARTRYDAAKIRKLALDTVRRPTGGRAVWHDGELTYAVAAPCATFGSLRATYVAIHEMLTAALARIGVEASLAPHRTSDARHPAAGACFAFPVGGEIVIGGQKLVGSAQVREGRGFLQHGSVLLEDCQDVVSSVTRGAAPETRATSLRAILGRSAEFAEVAEAIATESRRRWKGCWQEASRSPVGAGHGKFGDASWTWRR